MTIWITLNVASDCLRASTTAEESAGNVLAPVIAKRPAACAAGATTGPVQLGIHHEMVAAVSSLDRRGYPKPLQRQRNAERRDMLEQSPSTSRKILTFLPAVEQAGNTPA
jgi:hypothetical protein